jgi:hypothetical protein
MRVIYKNQGVNSPLPSHPSTGTKQQRESVLIISAEKKPETKDKSEEALSFTGKDYRVSISQEALDRNREVRHHEKAHMAALGSAAASGIIYNTVQGPGGETIATGGRIAVDLSEEPGDPAATLSKARTIINAAYAPAGPSGPDVKMASQAYNLARKAQDELKQEMLQEKVDLFA